MRTPFAASSFALFTAVVLSACSSSEPSEETASTEDALAIRGTSPPPPPPKKVFPPIHVPVTGVLEPATACTPKTRFDVRRKTRSCEDLPGAYVQGGVTFIPGTGGHYRVGRLLAGTAAPASLQAKACSYTWEPDSCAAPDSAKLLIESTEKLGERPSTCITNPVSCGINIQPPATHPPHSIPNGPGRCDVCGFASNRSLWVVLPPTWVNFSYTLAGTQSFVFTHEAPIETSSEQPTVVEVELPIEVEDQDVLIFASGG